MRKNYRNGNLTSRVLYLIKWPTAKYNNGVIIEGAIFTTNKGRDKI